MSNKGLVVVLIILVIVFGAAFLLTSDKDYLSNLNFLNKKSAVVPEQVVPLPTAEASKISTEEVKKLALGPGVNAKDADLKKYSESVNTASVLSNTLDVSSCLPTPNILSFNPLEPLTFVNKDSAPHAIAVTIAGRGVVLASVNPSSQTKVLVSILKPGIYSYVCDGQGPAGIFLVQ